MRIIDKRSTTLAGLMVCLLAVAAPALGQRTGPQPAGGERPVQTSDTASQLTGNGCPDDGPIQATPPDQCVAIPTRLVTVVDNSSSGCVQNEYVEAKVPAHLNYEAVWYSTIGEGTRWWTAPGTRYPHKVQGEGFKQKVPKGWSAWSAAGGAGPSGSCTGQQAPGTFGTAGWAVVGCNTERLSGAMPERSATRFGTPPDSSRASQSGQAQNAWQILSDTQQKIFEITQDVSCHKASKDHKAAKRWRRYAKHHKIKILTQDEPGQYPVSIDVLIKDPPAGSQDADVATSSASNATIAKASLTLRKSGKVTITIPLTSAGRSLIRHWLAGKPESLTTLADVDDPSLGWPTPPAFGSSPTSTTNAGYEYANYVAIPESVSATFVVPKVTCHAFDEAAIYPDVSVENNTSAAGVLVGCNGSHPYYWPSVTVDSAVTNYPATAAQPGDTIDLSVTQSDSATTATVTDLTHKFTVRQTGAGNGTGVDLFVGLGAWNASMELGTPHFGTVSFSKALLNGSPFGSFGSAGDVERYNRYTTADSSGRVQIATGPFASNEEAFHTNFEHP